MLRIISRCGDVDVGGKQRGVKGGDEHVNGGRWTHETREASLGKGREYGPSFVIWFWAFVLLLCLTLCAP